MFKRIFGIMFILACVSISVSASDTKLTHYEPYSDWAFDTGMKYNIIFTEKPQREITRWEVISLLYELTPINVLHKNIDRDLFSDINTLDYDNKQKINSVSMLGIVSGYDDGTFRPDNPVTRAEFITFLDRFKMLDKLKATNKGIKFGDISNHWAEEYIEKVVNIGLIKGKTESDFYPDDKISIEEVFIILDRLSNLSNIEESLIKSAILNAFPNSAREYSDDEKYMVEVIYKEMNKIQNEMLFYKNAIPEYQLEAIGSLATLEDILTWRYYYDGLGIMRGLSRTLSNDAEQRKNEYISDNEYWTQLNDGTFVTYHYFGLDGNVDYTGSVTVLEFLKPFCGRRYPYDNKSVINTKVSFSNILEYSDEEQYIIKNAVWKGLIPDSEYAFPGDSKITKALLNYITVKFNENRNIYVYSFHFLDKGAYMENDMSKMPSNYYLYPYIIRPVSNKAYEIPFMNNDKCTVWYPKDCYENLRYDYSNMNYFVKKYLNTIINIDYNTIDALKLSQTIEPYSKYDIELQKYDEYVKYVKDNKIIIEGTAQSCMPIVYYDTYAHKYRIRGKVNFKIKNSLTNRNILLGDLIFYGPKDYIPNYKEKNVIYNGNEFELYVDIPVSRFWPGSSYNLDDLICVANNISLNEQNNIYIQEN